jgi:hypothetical protein
MDKYNRSQLRQTLDLYKELSEAFVINDNPEAMIEKFDKAVDETIDSITGTG